MFLSDIFKKIRRLVPFQIRVEYFRLKRTVSNIFKAKEFTTVKATDLTGFKYTIFTHKTRLIREYPEPWYTLQYNKIDNLALIIPNFDNIVLPPNKKFSFWKIGGRTSSRKGFKEGMTLIDGQVSKSIGGGLCQLSNALFWAALHSGFDIVERHRHSMDIFPDTHRDIPFGSGATIFYNYVDLIFKNNLKNNYLFHIYLDDEFLHVEIYSDKKPDLHYKVVEENHTYIKENEKTFRVNELFRLHINNNGDIVRKELICKNKGLVLYDINKKNHA